jgi:NAD(P)-dependent dehydrogenase (short-subunit alcohol dehydrogenase family)
VNDQLFDLHGKVALVTGGGRGLGRGIARALAGAGAAVVVSSRSGQELAETVEMIGADGGVGFPLVADLSDTAAPARLVAQVGEERGGVDLLVHAAGGQVRKPALELTVEDWDEIQSVHLRAAFLLAQAVAQHLTARQAPGRIIFVASLTSSIGIPNLAPYGSAKTGLLGLMRTLATEWADTGITVNAIAPGFFHTELTDAVFEDDERRAWVLSRIPMGRPGRPEDLAGAAVFLASNSSSYVTGHVIQVDGGWMAA